MSKMTKRQFEEMFRAEMLPRIAAHERAGFPDKPRRRQAWNDTIDAYIRDRALPEAAGNWSHPRWLETARVKGARVDYATKKKSTKKSSAQLDREIVEAMNSKKRKRSVHSTITTAAPTKTKQVSKTKVIYVVQGNYGYGHGWEDLTAEDNRKEALAQLRTYRENERGVPHRLIRRRERIGA